MWDQLVATRLDAKQHWSISKCQKHVPTPDRKLFCATMGNVLLFYVNKQILIFQYFFIKRTGQLWLFKKIIRNITYYSSIVITRICTCLRALYCWFKKQQLLLFAYNEQTQLLQKTKCVVFLQIDIHDHLYLLLFDHCIKTYILCIKTIEMQKFTIALDRNSSVVNFRFVTPLKSKLKTAISGCVSLFPIFYISRSL